MRIINGYEIPTDEAGRVNLTEIWKRSGQKNKKPAQYKQLKRVQKIIEIMDWLAKRGKGSWADYLLALDYADYVVLKPISEPTNEPPPRDKFDEMWEKHQQFMADHAREQAEWEAGAEERERQAQEHRDCWKSLMDSLDNIIHQGNREGEEWKGADYHDATAGEEWKDGQGDGEGGEDKPSHAAWERGFDHFFMTFVNYRDTEIRASVN